MLSGAARAPSGRRPPPLCLGFPPPVVRMLHSRLLAGRARSFQWRSSPCPAMSRVPRASDQNDLALVLTERAIVPVPDWCC
jgi:hypothetical protein